MNKRRGGIIFVLLGVLMAGVAAFGVYVLAQQGSKSQPPMADVVVVQQAIPRQSIVTAPSLGVKSILLSSVPPGAVTHPTEAVGKMTTVDLYPGEVLLQPQLADTSGHSGLSYELKPGQVAITLPASDIIGTGALHVGDWIDVLITVLPKGNNSPQSTPVTANSPDVATSTTQIAFQNLEILGIGSIDSAAATTKSAPTGTSQGTLLTFAMSRQDSLFLKAMKDNQSIKIEVVLRAAGDHKIDTTEPVTEKSIIDRYHLR